jgi:predicted nuclease of predicted toxin-antitoxin system
LKLLFDACVWGGARARIAEAGHEAEWVCDWPTDPDDEEILAHALAAGQVLITLTRTSASWPYFGGRVTVGSCALSG